MATATLPQGLGGRGPRGTLETGGVGVLAPGFADEGLWAGGRRCSPLAQPRPAPPDPRAPSDPSPAPQEQSTRSRNAKGVAQPSRQKASLGVRVSPLGQWGGEGQTGLWSWGRQ